MSNLKRKSQDSELEPQEKKVKLDPVVDPYPSWFSSERSFFSYKDQELSASSFWLEFSRLLQQPLPLFKFKNDVYLICRDNKEEISFLPVNHKQPLTLERQPSFLPWYPVALSSGTHAEQVLALKKRLQTWFGVSSWTAFEEGFDSEHPWDATRSMWVQINSKMVHLMVAFLAVESSYSHFQWRWIKTEVAKEDVVTRGLGFGKSIYEALPLYNSGWLCLTSKIYPLRNGLCLTHPFMLPVGYVAAPPLQITGKVTKSFTHVYEPSGITIFQERLYVTNSDCDQIKVFDLEGNFIFKWGQRGSEPGKFKRPFDVTVFQDRVYVVDKYNHRIQVFNLQGHFLDQWGQKGIQPKEFYEPYAITMGKFQNQAALFVADHNNNRIQIFDPQGVFLSSWKEGLRFPRGLAFAEGFLYVANYGRDCVSVFTAEGSLVREFEGPSLKKFKNLEFLTVYRDKLLVTDKGRVSIYDLEGKFEQEICNDLKTPTGIAVANNRIYLADWNRTEIKIIE